MHCIAVDESNTAHAQPHLTFFCCPSMCATRAATGGGSSHTHQGTPAYSWRSRSSRTPQLLSLLLLLLLLLGVPAAPLLLLLLLLLLLPGWVPCPFRAPM
jgi:hypothetical protein